MTIKIDCPSGTPECSGHEFPDDWQFGGANGKDFRADPRWAAATYRYLDKYFKEVWISTSFYCDEQALDKFTWIASIDPSYGDVRYVLKRMPGEVEWVPLPWEYRADTDTIYPAERLAKKEESNA